MLRHTIVLSLITVFSFHGCATVAAHKVPEDQSLLAGYSTNCRSSVMLKSGSATYSSSLMVPAGKQDLIIEAKGELEDPEKYDSGKGYFCRDRTSHKLTFESEGGKTYRLHLDNKGDRSYEVSVWEGLDDRGIETKEITFNSVQTKIEHECRFFMGCDDPSVR